MKFRFPLNGSFDSFRLVPWICLFLVVTILVIYHPVGRYEFVNFDDPMYVIENDQVKKGLTIDSIWWAFSSMHVGNWHPVTWLSHMLDVELYGMNAGAHHLTNVVFHMLNSMLLFLLLHRMTGALWRSAMVAALFAVHPLHVESVAWISERKDVLSAFFGFLTLLTYEEYVKRPGRLRYGAALLLFALGLMSKPMVVTLPFLMLLLDYWPLNRYAEWGVIRRFAALVKEKLLFFALSAASCLVTMIAQGRGGAVAALEICSFGMRLANAIVAYVAYLGKMIWPMNLAILYPHPGMRPLWQVIGAVVVIVGISAVAFLWARLRPWLLTGWLWYLGTLIPVIGLVQVGIQSMADRYAYIPLIGIYMVLVWGFHEVLNQWRIPRLAFAGQAVLALLTFIAWHQVRYWENSITLYSHALEITDANWFVHNGLGNCYAKTNQIDKAINHYQEAIRIKPDYFEAFNNMGTVMAKMKRRDEAVAYFSNALRYNPDSEFAHNNLGRLQAEQKEYRKAIWHFREALRIKPDYPGAKHNLQVVLKVQADNQ